MRSSQAAIKEAREELERKIASKNVTEANVADAQCALQDLQGALKKWKETTSVYKDNQ